MYFEKSITQQDFIKNPSASWEVIVSEKGILDEDIPIEEDVVRSKIDIIKKRLADKGLIIEGDSYYRNNQLPFALKKYLEFYKKNPTDPLIIEKIAETYYEMKKFGSSLNYLQKLKMIPESKKELFVKSFLYSKDMSIPENIVSLENELKKYEFSQEQIFYYWTSVSCFQDFHTCKSSFQTYFDISKKTLTSASWGDIGIVFSPLKNIESAFSHYINFQVEDIALKNAYLIGAWYNDGMYPLAISLGEQLLQEKPGYKPILKIIAQSNFELWLYDKALLSLGEYYKIDPEDAGVAYMLWVVHERLKDYVLANIHLKKALELWFTPTITIRRQLIHNFYLLEQDESMLTSFVDMVEQEETLEADDLGIAIYYHILHEKWETAKNWSKKWQELFPENGDFYAYEGWILREENKLQEAFTLLQNGQKIDPNNPFILMNIGYTTKSLGNAGIAWVYFKKVIATHPESEWAIQAKNELTILEKNLVQ